MLLKIRKRKERSRNQKRSDEMIFLGKGFWDASMLNVEFPVFFGMIERFNLARFETKEQKKEKKIKRCKWEKGLALYVREGIMNDDSSPGRTVKNPLTYRG